MLTVTAHFIHLSKFECQANILFSIKSFNCSKNNIAKTIEDELTRWGVLQKVVFIICNRMFKDLLRAVKSILKKPIMFCVADKINDFIQEGLSHLNFEDLEIKCRNKPLLKKKKDDPFYWHDQYNILKHISENNAGDFSAEERKALGECFDFLKLFGELNNSISSLPYMPISLILRFYAKFRQEIRKCTPSTSQAKQLMDKILLPTSFFYHIFDKFALKAIFMDPRRKHILKRDIQNLEEDVKKELSERIILHRISAGTSTSNNQSGANNSQLDHLTDDSVNLADVNSLADATMSFYAKITPITANNIFKFWQDFNNISNCNQFYMMALKYLCIPATSKPVPSISGEYPWMKLDGNNINIYERRQYLDYENIDKILFLHSYYYSNIV